MNAEASTSAVHVVDESMEVEDDGAEVRQVPMDRSNLARERPLPQTQFYSVEYPGYVQDASVPKAVQNLGGRARLDQAFKRMVPKTESLIELALHPENPFAHPIPGDVVNTNNLVLRITKRRRKRRDEDPDDAVLGEYKAEIVGVTAKTVRFRSMADFQFLPDPEDPVYQLRTAMDKLDVDAITSYAIPHEQNYESVGLSAPRHNEFDMNIDPQLAGPSSAANAQASGSTSKLRLFPPPLFSRQTISQPYNFKSNPASILTTTIDEETGEEKKRLINKMRWKGYGPASIMFTDSHVPEKPPDTVEKGKAEANPKLLGKLQELFVSRPIWTRMSLFNQFSALESREILNSKIMLPLVCYVFQDGPWRDTLVKFGYDPRIDPNGRLYQRLYFRNANHPIMRPSVTTRRQERSSNVNLHIRNFEGGDDRKNSHVFDGKTVSKETAAFQLCDIIDPMLKEMIEDPDAVRDTCDERDGWYTSHSFERIKSILRHKFFSVLEGHPATDEECRNLLASSEHSTKISSSLQRVQKLRAGKHNMAKGAMRPEDAAAIRLRATLDRNVKSFTSSQRGRP